MLNQDFLVLRIIFVKLVPNVLQPPEGRYNRLKGKQWNGNIQQP
jgi:hypothetical protein